MATFSIVANGDDGFWYGSTFNNNDTDVELGNDGNAKDGFFRFLNVTIPAGAVIASAKLRFKARWNSNNDTCNLNCYFNNVDSAIAPTDATEANALGLTSAVAWSSIGHWTGDSDYDSPELKTILQTIVDRDGWSSGNAIMAVIKDNSSSSNASRRTYAYEYAGSGNAVELIVTYDFSIDCPSPFTSVVSLVATLPAVVVCPVPFSALTSMYAVSPGIWLTVPFIAKADLYYDIEINIRRPFISTGAISGIPVMPFTLENIPYYYLFILTGHADGKEDIRIPISSFGGKRAFGNPTYLSVVIPGLDYMSEISSRPNGTLRIMIVYQKDDEELLRAEIIQSEMNDMRVDEGTQRKSITLSGSKEMTWEEKSIAIDEVSYKSLQKGKWRFRIPNPNFHLNPGNRLNIEGGDYIIDDISWAVSPSRQNIEFVETDGINTAYKL